MLQVIAYEDAKAHQLTRQHNVKTPFLTPSADNPDSPVAFMIQDDPERITKPHYHEVDQFQVIVKGKGKFGGHHVAPYTIHFSRALTPYGPLLPDQETGWSFLTLRLRLDPGAHFFPESKDELRRLGDRQPWQISRQIKFPSQEGNTVAGGVNLQEVPDMKDDQGLFAYSLVMAPNTKTAAPDPSVGDGQFLVVVKGSVWHESKEHKALTIAFLEPEDGPFALHAGAEGLEALVMNFPRTAARTAAPSAMRATGAMKKWQCELCSFAYDEAAGLPNDGIPAGTRWEDVPESWTCPDCSSSKGDFKMVEVQ